MTPLLVLAACAPDSPFVQVDGLPIAVTPPPLAGGAVLDTQDGRVVVIDSDLDRVLIQHRPLDWGIVQFPAGWGPVTGVRIEDGRLVVLLRGADRLAAIDPDRYGVEVWDRACDGVRGLATDGSVLYVSCEGGELLTIDDDGGERDRVFVDRDLREVVVSDGQVWVSRLRSAEVLRVDPRSGAVEVRARPEAWFDDSLDAYAPHVARRLIARLDGGVALLHQLQRDVELTLPEPNVPPPYYSSLPTTCDDALTLSAITEFDRDGDVVASSPIAEQSWTDFAYVDGRPILGQGFVESTSDYLYESVYLDGTCQRIRRGSTRTVGILVRDGEPVAEVLRRPLEVIHADARDEHFPRSQALPYGPWDSFHEPGVSGAACYHCHPDGLDDGHVWKFPDIGPRRTMSLAGGVLDTAPFHWDGDLIDFPAFFEEVGGRRMSLHLDDDEVDALGDWIDRLPLALAAPTADDATIERGRALFEARDCARCHGGPAYTTSAFEDVGTGGTFQVPSLRGLASRAPYLHDGCAPTLADRFLDPICGGGEAHAWPPDADEADVAAIVAFLETL